MYTPDYDEYYSLKSYADRFVSDSDDVIKVYLSRPTTLNLITLWELRNGNDMFIASLMERYHERAMAGEEFDVGELISALNLLSVFIENGSYLILMFKSVLYILGIVPCPIPSCLIKIFRIHSDYRKHILNSLFISSCIFCAWRISCCIFPPPNPPKLYPIFLSFYQTSFKCLLFQN